MTETNLQKQLRLMNIAKDLENHSNQIINAFNSIIASMEQIRKIYEQNIEEIDVVETAKQIYNTNLTSIRQTGEVYSELN